MALIKCRECGHEIANSAKTCPNCGAQNRRNTGYLAKTILASLMLVLLGVLAANGFRSQRHEVNQTQGALGANGSSSSGSAAAGKPKPTTIYPVETPPRSLWKYSSAEDPISGKTILFARTASTKTFEFGIPYTQPQRASLMLRQHPRWGNDVLLSIERGQFLCKARDCQVTVRFDEGSPATYSATEPEDGSTTSLFITNYPRFLSNLRKSTLVRIEARFYQEGARVFEFKISGMEWDLSEAEKRRLSAAEADSVLESAKIEARARCNAEAKDKVDALNCEMAIGDCLRASNVTSARARCLSSITGPTQPSD